MNCLKSHLNDEDVESLPTFSQLYYPIFAHIDGNYSMSYGILVSAFSLGTRIANQSGRSPHMVKTPYIVVFGGSGKTGRD